jgi:hypothetical protein
MGNIPQGTKFHGVAPGVETSNKGSALANAQRDKYTIDDVVNYVGAKGLFTQTEDSTPVTNTTTETTIVANGEGSLSIVANQFAVGNTFMAYLEGNLSSLNNAQLTIRIKENGDEIATTGAMTLVPTSDNYYELPIRFVVRAIGVAGVASLMTSGSFHYTKTSNNSPEVIAFESLNNTTFDTTVDSTLNITAEWGAASTSNSIDTHVLTLQRIF